MTSFDHDFWLVRAPPSAFVSARARCFHFPDAKKSFPISHLNQCLEGSCLSSISPQVTKLKRTDREFQDRGSRS